MKTIDFSCASNVNGVIILANTGVEFSTQTGGMSCNHPAVEGIFIPTPNIDDETEPFHDDVCGLIPGTGPHASSFQDRVEASVAVAKFLTILRDQYSSIPVTLDDSRLAEMHEAWIPVIITKTDEFSPFHEFEGEKGILIYGNCD